MIDTPKVDWLALSPTLALLAAGGIALLAAVLVPRMIRPVFCAVTTGLGFLFAGILAIAVFDRTPESVSLISESMIRDRYAAFAQIIVAGAGLLTVLLVAGAKRREHIGEYYALIAVAGAGMVFFVSAENLMTLFLGVEWFSIALYILCAMDTHRRASLEAGLKYLIVGSFGTAILLFGSALTYGATGELGFGAIADAGSDDALLLAGMAMIVAGLAFKASAAPFHMWTPDVYEGAPTPVTAFMSAATKVVAVVALLRILVTAFPEQSEIWTIAVAVIAVISLVVGNFGALAQKDVKRLLAYSSISNAGFLLIAIAADSELGGQALLYYLIPYCAMSIGSFAVVLMRERELNRAVAIRDFGGYGWERPLVGAGLWIFMLGFAGFPLTGGMLAKFYVLAAAYESDLWWLVVIGVLATALGLYYYLGVIRALYMRPNESDAALRPVVSGGAPPRDYPLQAAVALAAVVTIGSFFFVGPIGRAAGKAAASLIGL
jgi:NADH-quinone oxidoreductase subunit N